MKQFVETKDFSGTLKDRSVAQDYAANYLLFDSDFKLKNDKFYNVYTNKELKETIVFISLSYVQNNITINPTTIDGEQNES